MSLSLGLGLGLGLNNTWLPHAISHHQDLTGHSLGVFIPHVALALAVGSFLP